VGHSAGGLVVRAALRRPELAPYLPALWTFLSVAAPHLGFVCGTNALVGGAVRCMAMRSPCLKQLSLRDAPRLEDCELYRLAEAPGFGLFRHVILVTCRADAYVPLHSAGLTACASSEGGGGGRGGAAVRAMLAAISGQMDQGRDTQVTRVEVDFAGDVKPWTFGNLIGRTAHVAFVETERYARALTWALLHRQGLFAAHADALL
jgi:hypothetical protein